MVKSCCPFNRVDWNEPGGLCHCNWPCCCPDDPLDRDTRYTVIIQEHDHLLIELDGTTSIPPLCLLCWFSLIPVVLIAVVAVIPTGHIQAVAWQFDVENGHLVLRERVKHVCSESSILKLSSVRSVLVETYTEREPGNGRRVIRGRLRVVGVGPDGDESARISINAPKKLITDHSLDLLREIILQMIPQRFVEEATGALVLANLVGEEGEIHDAIPADAECVIVEQPELEYAEVRLVTSKDDTDV